MKTAKFFHQQMDTGWTPFCVECQNPYVCPPLWRGMLVRPSRCSPMHQSDFVVKCTKVVTRFIQKATMCVPEELDDVKDDRALDGSKIGKENPAFAE